MSDDEDFPLTEAQEESLQMVRQAVIESDECGVPGEILLFMLIQIASELAVGLEVSKKDFMKGASSLYDDEYEDMAMESAAEMKPLEE